VENNYSSKTKELIITIRGRKDGVFIGGSPKKSTKWSKGAIAIFMKECELLITK